MTNRRSGRTWIALLFAARCCFLTLPQAGCERKERADAKGKQSAQAPSPRELTVAAAADLKFALGEIVAAFESEHAEVKVKVTYGSSGNLFAQQLSNKT